MSELTFGGFNALKAMDPSPCKPFDKRRAGMNLGEGAAILILEDFNEAIRRGAEIYVEFLGYGVGGEAYHITAPSPGGEGAARCMAVALKDGKTDPSEIHYINAHGTSTKFGDEIETHAIKKIFGKHAYQLAVSSTKSMTGHLLGAAGGVEAIISVMSIFNNHVPPTINLDNPDPECDLDYVPHTSRKMTVHYAITNSFGFGGTNACLIFKKFGN